LATRTRTLVRFSALFDWPGFSAALDGGRSLASGGPAAWFDYRAFDDVIRGILGDGYPPTFWSYPPHIVLFLWPFGLLPYLPAYILWCAAGIALFLLASSSAVGRSKLCFLALTPGIVICVYFGQNGFYTAALLAGGLLNRERRPLLSGILFGILTVKPQLGLLVPVLLLLERRWLVIAAAAATAALLVTVTSLLFGWHIWVEYWQMVMPQQFWIMEKGNGLGFHASFFGGARLIGLSLHAAWLIQYAASASALCAVVWTFWRRRDPGLSLALFIAAAFLFSPYVLSYDMVIFGLIVAMLRDRTDNTAYDHGLLIAVWSLPVTMLLTAIVAVPLPPILLTVFAMSLIVRLRRQSSAQYGRTLPSTVVRNISLRSVDGKSVRACEEQRLSHSKRSPTRQTCS